MKHMINLFNKYINHFKLLNENEISCIKNLNTNFIINEEWEDEQIFKIKSNINDEYKIIFIELFEFKIN